WRQAGGDVSGTGGRRGPRPAGGTRRRRRGRAAPAGPGPPRGGGPDRRAGRGRPAETGERRHRGLIGTVRVGRPVSRSPDRPVTPRSVPELADELLQVGGHPGEFLD